MRASGTNSTACSASQPLATGVARARRWDGQAAAVGSNRSAAAVGRRRARVAAADAGLAVLPHRALIARLAGRARCDALVEQAHGAALAALRPADVLGAAAANPGDAEPAITLGRRGTRAVVAVAKAHPVPAGVGASVVLEGPCLRRKLHGRATVAPASARERDDPDPAQRNARRKSADSHESPHDSHHCSMAAHCQPPRTASRRTSGFRTAAPRSRSSSSARCPKRPEPLDSRGPLPRPRRHRAVRRSLLGTCSDLPASRA